MRVYSSVTDIVGHTPLVRLNKLTKGLEATVLVKFEALNPASSVKDRVAVNIVDAAEKSGALKPGGTIVEATSGNTGVALAMVGAARGYNVVITMPESMSVERRQLMAAFGAELVLTPASEGMQGTVDAANKILQEREGAIMASQFTNPANPEIHSLTTAKEIWEDTDGTVDAFVSGIGTGGTITGVSKTLKQLNSGIHIVGIEPAESPLLTEGNAGPHKIQGIGANFVPKVLDQTNIDEMMTIPSQDALDYARRATREEGLLVGISSGAAIAGALELAKRKEFAGKTIVAILPDTGERYLSTFANLS